jgi:hypothetical protein
VYERDSVYVCVVSGRGDKESTSGDALIPLTVLYTQIEKWEDILLNTP